MLHGCSLVLQLWLGHIEKHNVENIETVRQVFTTQYASMVCRCTTKYDTDYLLLKPIVF